MEWGATHAGPVNILLVDDEPANILALEAMLGDLGQNLVRATSGEAALRRVLERDFAAILLDVRMPTLNGFETAKLIRGRSRSRATPIIFITAALDGELSAEEAYALGAVDYLAKPLVPTVLRAKVAVFVELHQKTEALKAAERERADAAVRASEGQLRLVTDSAPVYLARCDPDARFLFVNRPYAARFGLTPTDVVGRRIPEVLGEAAYTTLRPYVDEVTTGRAVEFEVEVPYPAGPRHMHCAYVPETTPVEGRFGFVAVIQDVTKQRAAEEGASSERGGVPHHLRARRGREGAHGPVHRATGAREFRLLRAHGVLGR